MTTQELPNGSIVSSSLRRPYAVRAGRSVRSYGSLDAARRAAPAGAVIFFDYAPGCGRYLEGGIR